MKKEDESFVRDMCVIFTQRELDRLQSDVNCVKKDKEFDEATVEKTQRLISIMRSVRREISKYNKIKNFDKLPEKAEIESCYEAYVKLEMHLMKSGKEAYDELERRKVEKVLSKIKK